MSTLTKFSEYHARLVMLIDGIDDLIGDCPADPEEVTLAPQRVRDLLGTAHTAIEDAADEIGYAVQAMQEREKEHQAPQEAA